MTETLQILLLAILQGITEFLPISSSAHLVFLQEILEKCGLSTIEETYTLGIALHLASLLAILCYYWRPLLRLALGRDIPLLKLIIWGSLPVAIVGFGVKLFLDDFFEEKIFNNVPLVACLLWVTAAVLLVGQKIVTGGKTSKRFPCDGRWELGWLRRSPFCPAFPEVVPPLPPDWRLA